MSEEKNIPEEQHKDQELQSNEDSHETAAENQTAVDNLQPAAEPESKITNANPDNYREEIKIMEVHHPHHVTHKKKWSEYLLEFTMLFLAVFLGFLAENIREHAVEKARARQYSTQLINDLKIDAAQLDSSTALNTMISKKLDSLRHLIDQKKSPNRGQLYYYGRFATWYNRITPNDATLQQMKSSGAIRYFHNPEVEKMISEYDRLLRRLQNHETGEYSSLTEMWLLSNQIFRGDILDLLNDLDKPRPYYESFMQKTYPLVSSDPVLLQRFSNLCRARQLWIKYKIEENLKPAFKAATELIKKLENR